MSYSNKPCINGNIIYSISKDFRFQISILNWPLLSRPESHICILKIHITTYILATKWHILVPFRRILPQWQFFGPFFVWECGYSLFSELVFKGTVFDSKVPNCALNGDQKRCIYPNTDRNMFRNCLLEFPQVVCCFCCVQWAPSLSSDWWRWFPYGCLWISSL